MPPAMPWCLPWRFIGGDRKHGQGNTGPFAAHTLGSLKYEKADLSCCESSRDLVMKRDIYSFSLCALNSVSPKPGTSPRMNCSEFRDRKWSVLSVQTVRSSLTSFLSSINYCQSDNRFCSVNSKGKFLFPILFWPYLIIWIFAFSIWQIWQTSTVGCSW